MARRQLQPDLRAAAETYMRAIAELARNRYEATDLGDSHARMSMLPVRIVRTTEYPPAWTGAETHGPISIIVPHCAPDIWLYWCKSDLHCRAMCRRRGYNLVP